MKTILVIVIVFLAGSFIYGVLQPPELKMEEQDEQIVVLSKADHSPSVTVLDHKVSISDIGNWKRSDKFRNRFDHWSSKETHVEIRFYYVPEYKSQKSIFVGDGLIVNERASVTRRKTFTHVIYHGYMKVLIVGSGPEDEFEKNPNLKKDISKFIESVEVTSTKEKSLI